MRTCLDGAALAAALCRGLEVMADICDGRREGWYGCGCGGPGEGGAEGVAAVTEERVGAVTLTVTLTGAGRPAACEGLPGAEEAAGTHGGWRERLTHTVKGARSQEVAARHARRWRWGTRVPGVWRRP